MAERLVHSMGLFGSVETIRLEVRHRSVLLDARPFNFITEEGASVEETATQGVVDKVQRHMRRRLRGKARDFGLAQILGSLRAFNSPKEGHQFAVVERSEVERLQPLEGLSLPPKKTGLVPCASGVPFLGYVLFADGRRRVQGASVRWRTPRERPGTARTVPRV